MCVLSNDGGTFIPSNEQGMFLIVPHLCNSNSRDDLEVACHSGFALPLISKIVYYSLS